MIYKILLIVRNMKIEVVIVVLIILSSVYASELKVTNNHPFLVNGTWIEASELNLEDELTMINGKKAIIKSIQDLVEENEVFNFETGLQNYVANDAIVHNSRFIPLREPSRTTMNVEFTTNCNELWINGEPIGCATCPRNFKDKGEMPLETFQKVLDRVDEDYQNKRYISGVNIAGRGEPTTYSRFYEALEMIADFKKTHPGIKFTIVTNADQLNSAKYPALVSAFDEIKISFASYSHHVEIYRHINRERVLENMKSLSKYMGDNEVKRKIKIHVTPTEYTLVDLPETISVVEQIFPTQLYETTFIVFPFTTNRGGNLDDIPIKLNPQEALLSRIISNLISKGHRITRLESEFPSSNPKDYLEALKGQLCLNKGISLPIKYDGGYGYCINDWCSQMKVGNVEEKGIEQVLRDRIAMEQQNGLAPICEECNVIDNLSGRQLVNIMYSNIRVKMAQLKYRMKEWYNENTRQCSVTK